MKFIVTDGTAYYGPFNGEAPAARFGYWYFSQRLKSDKVVNWEVIKVFLPAMPPDCRRSARLSSQEKLDFVDGGRIER